MTQIAQQTFGAALLYIGAVLDKLGYRYQFWDQNTAAFDGETFFFPKFPMELSEKALTYIWGYVYHEIGHALFTDFDAVNKAQEIGGVTQAVYLVFEDVWQEHEYNKRTPYSRKRLSELTAVMASDDLLGPTLEDTEPNNSLVNFLLNYGYGEVLRHQPVDDFVKSDEIHLANCFNQAVVDKVKAITLNLTSCENSHEVLELAQMVTKSFEEEKPKPPEQQDSNKSSDQNGNEPSDNSSLDSQSGNEDNSQDDKAEPNQSNSSDSSSTPNNGDMNTKSDNVKSGSGNGEGHSLDDSLKSNQQVIKAFDDILNASVDDFKKTERTDSIQHALSQSIKESGDPLPFIRPNEPCVSSSNWNEFIQRGEKSGTGLIPKFKRVFESQTKTRKVRQRKGRRLARNFTLKMLTSDPRLFVNKHHKTGVDTHISVVLDDSISMKSDSKMEVSLDAISAIGIASDITKGVSFSACSFPSRYDYNSVEILCRENERFKAVSDRFKPISASGMSTPMANGIIWAMEQCSRSKNPRKIIIVITDGCPNSGHRSLVNDMVDKCQKHGVEIWGIGIKVDGVKNYFSDHMIINDVSELPHKLLNKITKTL